MKKLTTLLFVLVFASSMAFAQNDADVDQSGNNNNSTIDQTYRVGYNDADVTQTGDRNVTDITQSTTGSFSGNDSYTEATVNQTGNRNRADLDQAGFYGWSDASVSQTGNRNYAGLTTQNGGGYAEINMDGNSNWFGGLNSRSQAVQKNNNNDFYLDILGNNNVVRMGQEGAYADVALDGSRNNLSLSQRNSGYTAVHSANINVLGNANNLDVEQLGRSGGTGGSNNYTDIDLINYSHRNTVSVTQHGSNMSADVLVDGNSNHASITQTGVSIAQ